MSYNQPDPSEGVTPLGKSGRSAYLSPEQFMPMRRVKQVMAMDAPHSPGITGDDIAEDVADDPTVADLIPSKAEDVESGEGDTADYGALRHTMSKEGPRGTTTPPIWVRGDLDADSPQGNPNKDPSSWALGNGGHRAALADELGWHAMRYTGDRAQSGYGDARFPHTWDGDPELSAVNSDDPYYENSSVNSDEGSTNYSDNTVSQASQARRQRNHIPGQTGYSWQAHAGARWHEGGGPLATHGLYTELHGPAAPEGPAKAAEPASSGQGVLPGMPGIT